MADRSRYSTVAILFHWTIAALILVNLWLGFAHDALPRGWAVMPLHKSIGMTVLALSVARVGWRLAHPVPPLPLDMPVWQRRVARLTHGLLYALMLAMPLSGWVMVSHGEVLRPLTWFGLFHVPYLTLGDPAGDIAHDVHEWLGWPFAALIALHASAAIKHHFVDGNAVLWRMLPIFRRPTR